MKTTNTQHRLVFYHRLAVTFQELPGPARRLLVSSADSVAVSRSPVFSPPLSWVTLTGSCPRRHLLVTSRTTAERDSPKGGSDQPRAVPTQHKTPTTIYIINKSRQH